MFGLIGDRLCILKSIVGNGKSFILVNVVRCGGPGVMNVPLLNSRPVIKTRLNRA